VKSSPIVVLYINMETVPRFGGEKLNPYPMRGFLSSAQEAVSKP